MQQVGGLVHRDVAEEGPDGGEPRIPAARAVPPSRLDVQKEVANEICVEVLDPEPGNLTMALASDESEEKPERIAVAFDRRRA